MIKLSYPILALLLALSFFSNSGFAEKKKIWVYTSIYKEFATPLAEAFQKKNPDIEVNVFQGGSEKLQAKVEAELVSNTLLADVLLSSDPFWARDLEKRQLLDQRPKHESVETNYYSLMILITHKNFPKADRPKSFSELTNPKFKNLIQMGSPLESGTTFTTVAYLSEKYGWDYFKKLRENEVASSGGNSTVIQKVETGEKKLGIVLLENALAAQKRGSPIEIIYPQDGSIPIPSVQIIMKNSKEKSAASQFADFILSQEGQQILKGGYMYSVRKDVTAPDGAEPLSVVTKNSTPWNADRLMKVAKESKSIKKQFSEIVLQ